MSSLKNLQGKWHMTKESSDVSDTLDIQGFGKAMQWAVSKAPVNIIVTQESEDKVTIKQTTTASIPGVTEQWVHDWEFREFKDPLFGKLKSKSRYAKPSDVEESFLKDGLDDDREVIEAEVRSLEHGWVARQIWCFEGEKFVRRVITSKDDRKSEARLVYELVR